MTGSPSRMGYAGAALLRSGEERDAETLARALADPQARIHLRRDGRWLHRGPADDPQTLFAVEEARALGGSLAEAVLLGWTPGDGAPRLALALESTGDHFASIDLRAAGMAESLSPDAEGELAQAHALLNWHARTRFCGVCGGETVPTLAGYRRDCTRCATTHFPRTDPVAIMLVHDGRGNALLGRQGHFTPGMWSCLAGFVEAGETIEDAVRREILEEAGIAVGPVSYRLSQPWPFPNSLMIGCEGLAADTGTIVLQESELEAARWFAWDELKAMVARTHRDGLSIPPRYAIAHHLLVGFLEKEEAGKG